MNRAELLLTQLSEECAEVSKEVSKCIRFGPEEVYAPIGLTNAQRVMLEVMDVLAMVNMLQGEKVLPEFAPEEVAAHIDAKTEKVERHLVYSAQCGRMGP